MYDYGLEREDRLSQVPSGHKFPEDRFGSFHRGTKQIFVTPRIDVRTPEQESIKSWEARVFPPKGKKRLPFIGETWYPDIDATISTEQHEFTHAFLDMLKHAVKDEEVLSTLSKKDKLKIFKYMDFMQKQQFTPSGRRKRTPKGNLVWQPNIEHKAMDQSKGATVLRVKEGKGYEHPLGGTKPEVFYTKDVRPPKKDSPKGEGISKQTTINDIAKAFIKAATKTSESAKVHKRFLKNWRTAGYIRDEPTTKFEEEVQRLQENVNLGKLN